MTVEVVDFFRIDEAAGGSEPVATLVGYELQGDATPQFRELWQRRPREVAYHYGDSSEEACVLYARDVTLEDEPGIYLSALNSWLIEHGYVLHARP